MMVRLVRSVLVPSALAFGVIALAPVTAQAQTASIPEEGGPITMVGCFTTAVTGHKTSERFVLAKPVVGSVASVPDATCTASSADQMIKLQDLKHVHLGHAQLGRWVEISGRLEGNHRSDGLREVHVKSFSLVPVVPPRAAENVAPPRATFETPAPRPVPTAGKRTQLPKTATTLPLFGLSGLVSVIAAFALHMFRRRNIAVL
jgi:LPXTG-motif cell wall-anchored protein